MKQYKISLLVVVGLAFATMLWMKKAVDPAAIKDGRAQAASAMLDQLPQAPAASGQQIAVESRPVPLEPPTLLQSAAPTDEVVAQAQPIVAIEESSEGNEVLSYLEFLYLPENYEIRSYEIGWREYRKYRKENFAKSL